MFKKQQGDQYGRNKANKKKRDEVEEEGIQLAFLAILKILSFSLTEERSYQMISSRGITLCNSGFNGITLIAELRTDYIGWQGNGMVPVGFCMLMGLL